jgi:hypothetical protein
MRAVRRNISGTALARLARVLPIIAQEHQPRYIFRAKRNIASASGLVKRHSRILQNIF